MSQTPAPVLSATFDIANQMPRHFSSATNSSRTERLQAPQPLHAGQPLWGYQVCE